MRRDGDGPGAVSGRSDAPRRLVLLRAADLRCAVDASEVREVAAYAPADDARGPDGGARIRSSVLPVLDLRRALGREPAQPTASTRVVRVLVFDRPLGLLVDAVSDVVEIPQSAVRPLPGYVRTFVPEHVQAVADVGDAELVVVLRADRLLEAEDAAAIPLTEWPD